MIVTLADYRNYFAALAAELGCSFEFGNSERILNRQSSALVYPLLWLEIPDIVMSRSDGGLNRVFRSAFICLSDTQPDDYSGQDTALDAMYALTEKILQLLQQRKTNKYLFDMEGCNSHYKGKWSADDDWGWRTEFELTGAACEEADCCD